MGQTLRVAIAATLGFVTFAGAANAQSDPPGRIGRLAYINGTVSFHDDEETQWAPAAVNTPLTTGDSLWTEPNARSEVSISGTRVRMDGATELDLLAVDDNAVRMQVPQGRLDIKAAAMDKPYEIVTPRGTVALEQQGDYYILAGSTEDPTRLGVRSGAAQITGLNGQTLAVRAGEVGEVSGDSGAPVLHTIKTAPPPMQPYWAERDRQVSYDAPQYLSTSVTGYEDLNANGGWSNDGTYGQVWTPRTVPAGWEPYRNGHWSYVQPWGWTWVDEQPWGFAPFHYGRWVNANNRWSWVPPARETRAVYAPALVSFIGAAAELLLTANQPPSVGWFPLGPREVYVPPYTTNRDYFRNVNRANVRDQALIDARYQWAEQHRDAQRPPPNDPRFTHVNQRFATVAPQQAFQRSQPIERVAIKVAPEKLAAAPVAPVAAPPVAARNPEARPQDGKAAPARTPDGKPQPETRANAAPPNGAGAHTAFANMETIGKPTNDEKRNAPGPKVEKRADAKADAKVEAKPGAKPENGPAKANEAPPLRARTGAAPAPLKGEVVDNKAGDNKAGAQGKPEVNAKPGEPARPEAPKPPAANQAKGAPAPAEHPALVKPGDEKGRPEPPKLPAAETKGAPAPGARPEAPKPPAAAEKAEPPKPPAAAGKPEAPKPPAAVEKAEPPKPPAAAGKPEAPKPPAAAEKAEPPKPPAAAGKPEAPKPPAAAEKAEPPKPPVVARPAEARPTPAPEPPHQAVAPQRAPEPPHAAAPPPQRAPEPPHQAAAPPPPQHQAPPPQAQHAPPPPHQAPPPQQAHAPAPPQQAPAPHPQAPAQKEEKK